jgi:hypothetical protein
MYNLNIANKIQKSLKYSLYDGIFYSIMLGFGESFFQAFGIFLKAGNIELGLLSSMPIALGSLSQLLSNRFIILFKSRKKLVSKSALLHGLMYLPIALVFFLGNTSVYFLIFFSCCYGVFGMILGPAWNS